MRLLPFCLLITSFLAASVLGEESCDASSSAADASGRNVCTPKDNSQDIDDDDDDDDDDDYYYDDDEVEDEDDDDGDDDSKINEEKDADHPIWWNYDIDELFEKHFDCFAIVYGYGYDGEEERAQVNSRDDLDGDSAADDSGGDPVSKDDTEQADMVSEVQLRKIRQQWALMREKYVKEVHLVPIEIHYAEGDVAGFNEDTHVSNYGVSSLIVPSRIGDAGPDKGRGVFATDHIPKGTLVVSLDNGSVAIFKEGHSWREFIATLPREAACNCIEWSWVQTIPPENEIDDDIRNGLTIFVSFDESNLMNAADWGDGVEANVSCGRPPMHEGDERGLCRFHYYAARDIAAGEELLVNYGEFEDMSQEGWVDIGL